MAQQDVIYPAAPLIIVDRQWRRKSKEMADTPTFAINRPSTKRDVTISVLNEGGCIPKSRPRPAHQVASNKSKFQFVQGYDPSQSHRPKHQIHRSTKRKAQSTTVANPPDSSPSDSSTLATKSNDSSTSLSLSPVVPSSSTTFYGYASGGNVHSDAQELLHYCMFHLNVCVKS